MQNTSSFVWITLHLISQDLDLLLHLYPQNQVIQIIVPVLYCCTTSNNDQKSGHEGLLHVGETEFVRDPCYSGAETSRKLDFLVVPEFMSSYQRSH